MREPIFNYFMAFDSSFEDLSNTIKFFKIAPRKAEISRFASVSTLSVPHCIMVKRKEAEKEEEEKEEEEDNQIQILRDSMKTRHL